MPPPHGEPLLSDAAVEARPFVVQKCQVRAANVYARHKAHSGDLYSFLMHLNAAASGTLLNATNMIIANPLVATVVQVLPPLGQAEAKPARMRHPP